jgi:hypothetical protein
VFKSALFKEDTFREDFCVTVKDKTGFSLEKKMVTCRNGTVNIKADPYLKTEIFLKQNDILAHMREKYPEKNIRSLT